jgi:hypothetical protein
VQQVTTRNILTATFRLHKCTQQDHFFANTEQDGLQVYPLDLHSADAQFKSQRGHQLSWLEIFCGIPQSLQPNAGAIPWLVHYHFPPHAFQVIIHHSITWQIVLTLKVSLNGNKFNRLLFFKQYLLILLVKYLFSFYSISITSNVLTQFYIFQIYFLLYQLPFY